MFRPSGVVLAFMHFAVTEMRPIWIMWYTIYNTFESIVTTASISDAYRRRGVTECLHEKKIKADEIEECAEAAYRSYLASGPQNPYKACSDQCSDSLVGVEAPEPRNMLFFASAALSGFVLVLFLYFIHRRPNYYTGSYIGFTQSLYDTKLYKLAVNCISLFSIIMILIGIGLLISYGYGWRQHVVALFVIVMKSRSLALRKSNGLDITTTEFRNLKVARGNALVSIWNFFMTSNAVILDEMEVQIMNKALPKHVCSPTNDEGCCEKFINSPSLSDKTMDAFLTGKAENKGRDNTGTV